MFKKTSLRDSFILSLLVVVITFHPYYLTGQLNFFELGLYLPGINAILQGQIPFRDFFHLRGPFELYMPAFLMALLGKEVWVLLSYFYFGTVLTLMLCVFLGGAIYKSRLFLYLMVPVLVTRTFPRVVFTFWGGMRYALGMAAILMAVYFFKNRKSPWMFLSGLLCVCGFLTSSEIGVCAIAGILSALGLSWIFNREERPSVMRGILLFAAGMALVFISYGIYLQSTHALKPFLESIVTVSRKMSVVFDVYAGQPVIKDIPHAITLFFSPWMKNFKFMTPAYLYVIVFGWIFWRVRGERRLDFMTASLVCLGVYGFLLYVTAFRNIEASQFEMALQPEKILLFFILEEIYFRVKGINKEWNLAKGAGSPASPRLSEPARANLKNQLKKILIAGFVPIVIFSSAGYSIQRFLQMERKDTKILKRLNEEGLAALNLPRVKGLRVPTAQAREIEAIQEFINKNTKPHEKIFMFPELGAYSFIVDRPFVGRFPMATFSWLKEGWHTELLVDLNLQKPKYAILPKIQEEKYEIIYFLRPQNRGFYRDIQQFIESNYKKTQETPFSVIYQFNHR